MSLDELAIYMILLKSVTRQLSESVRSVNKNLD